MILLSVSSVAALVTRTLPTTTRRSNFPRATPKCVLQEPQPVTTTGAAPGSVPFTVIQKDIKMPDPIPREGIDGAVALMETGKLYRYNVPDAESSVVSQCEVRVGESDSL